MATPLSDHWYRSPEPLAATLNVAVAFCIAVAAAGSCVITGAPSNVKVAGWLMRLDTLLYHPETLEALKADVRSLASLDVGVFKTRYGVTRKFAIPLLEYLDRERVTRRVGDKRVVNQ